VNPVAPALERAGVETVTSPPDSAAAVPVRAPENIVRLLIVTDAWFPQINGVVRTLSTTRERLQALGHHVDVIAPDRFRSMPCPTYPEIRLALCTPARVGRLIEQSAPEAVHIATEGPLGWAARSWMRRRGLPFTSSFHTMFPEYLKLRFGLPERLSYSGIRRFHSGARATMYSTPTLRAMLESRGFGNLVRWVRGVDTELFTPGPAEPLPFPRPLQLYVGRIAVEKSIEDFLRLDTPGTKIVVGDGPQRAELAARYPDVRFLGTLRGDALVRHYRAADVFVFPSRTDTLGLVMLEALACGVPVAAYPVQGPVDVVGDSGVGVLDADLAAAVRGAIGIDPARCRDRALAFSWDESVREFLGNLVPIDAPPGWARQLRGETV
jgi:glycosyltransferase involved in cell wall biosynthesis